MKPAALFGHSCSGHDCFPPRPNVEASPDVFINGLSVQRMGDTYMPHCCPNKGCHSAVVAQGSSSVTINGVPVARMGDSLSCPSVIAEGSSNVFVGG
jgi:uncharacterized Zn-binding protein involved in type VI secretion